MTHNEVMLAWVEKQRPIWEGVVLPRRYLSVREICPKMAKLLWCSKRDKLYSKKTSKVDAASSLANYIRTVRGDGE